MPIKSYTSKMATADTRARAVPIAKPAAPAVRPLAPKPIPKPAPKPKIATAAQLKAINPSGQSTLGWNFPSGFNPYGTQSIQDWSAEQEQPSYSFDSGGGGGGMPGWGYDVGLMESQRDEDIGSFRSGMGTKIKQALIDLGLSDTSQLDPEARSYVDDATIEAAKQNKYSLFSQLQQKADRATAQSRAKLAARGMLSSGQLTKEAQDVLNETESARYAGVREFSGGVGDLVGQYAQRQREWANRIAEARMQAAASGYSGYGGGGGGGGGGFDAATGRGYDTPERGARPGEWADLPVRVGYNPARNSDAEYDMSGATRTDWGFIGPEGARYDENGRRI